MAGYPDPAASVSKPSAENANGVFAAGRSTPIRSRRFSEVSSETEVVPEDRHLVLYFDINKTVLMTDATNGKTAEQIVNETIANTSWGIEVERRSWYCNPVSRDQLHKILPLLDDQQLDSLWSSLPEALPDWRLYFEEPSVCRPTSQMVSHVEWIEKLYPGRDNNATRNKLNGTFTYPGRPGARMQPFCQKLIDSLKNADGSEMRIIPSFFNLMIKLKERRKSFCLCFRTFGEDLRDVAKELNMFCEGKHAMYPGVIMDGSDGQPDYRLSVDEVDQLGTFYRDDNELCLVMGTVEQPGEGKFRKVSPSLEFYTDTTFMCETLKIPKKDLHIIRGEEEVVKFLWEKTMHCGTLGIRDYFEYWKRNKMKPEGGKPFFFNPTESVKVHSMFFDDNIRYGDAHIVNAVDLRDPPNCSRIPFIARLLQTHLCRSEPLEAIKDPYYFVKQIDRLEVGYERSLMARGRLIRILRQAARKAASLGSVAFKELEKADLSAEQYDAWKELRIPSEIVSVLADDDFPLGRRFGSLSPSRKSGQGDTVFGDMTPKRTPLRPAKEAPELAQNDRL